MGHAADWWERLRGGLIPKLGAVTQLLEDITGDKYYVESTTHRNQFVGRVPMSEEQFEQELHDMGFDRNPLAAWKHLGSTKNAEEASFRKVGFEDHPEMQLHVILYDGSKIANAPNDHTFVYAHWEYRWDKHPWKHYRGVNYDAQKGVKRMKSLLGEHGISFEAVRP